jgi:SAM-dependent methyltransferase
MIGWIVDRVAVDGTELTISGWALTYRVHPDTMLFLINGVPFQTVQWPLPSSDVGRVFETLPFAESCRFSCRHTVAAPDELFVDDYACLSFVPPYGLNQDTYRRAEFVLNPALESPLPDHGRINRVISGDAMSYRLGGSTLAKRLDAYLAQRFGRPLASFASVLDWGSGAGRVTRHLIRLCTGQVTGIDIDADNVAWCAGALPGARFLQGPLLPPLPCADGSFDLVITISVFTHLDAATQFLWLAELRRIVRRGGIVLASIHGMAQMALYGAGGQQVCDTCEQGFVVLGQNSQLDGFIPDATYYKNVAHSPDYVLREWREYFDVTEIVEGIAAHQDLVVMVRR